MGIKINSRITQEDRLDRCQIRQVLLYMLNSCPHRDYMSLILTSGILCSERIFHCDLSLGGCKCWGFSRLVSLHSPICALVYLHSEKKISLLVQHQKNKSTFGPYFTCICIIFVSQRTYYKSNHYKYEKSKYQTSFQKKKV